MEKGGCVYIITNKNHTTLYVGVTSNLLARVVEHVEKLYKHSFSAKYNLDRLIYFENFNAIEEAIIREKYIKGKSRKWKEELINSMNPEWNDLTQEVMSW